MYGHKYALIKMYGLGRFIVVYTNITMFTKISISMRVSESHKFAKFHTLVWCSLLVMLAEFKNQKKMKNFGPIEK